VKISAYVNKRIIFSKDSIGV